MYLLKFSIAAALLLKVHHGTYWVTQKLPQIYTANHATFPIRIRKFTVQICGNLWVTQHIRWYSGDTCEGKQVKKSDFRLLSIEPNAVNISNYRFHCKRAHIFLRYHLPCIYTCCCCCLPCNHWTWVVEEFQPFGDRLRFTHCREFLYVKLCRLQTRLLRQNYSIDKDREESAGQESFILRYGPVFKLNHSCVLITSYQMLQPMNESHK